MSPNPTASHRPESSAELTPADLFRRVVAPSAHAEDAARAHHLQLTKPAGSLGRLEEVGIWLAACQDQVPPHRITKPRIVVFAGDHGVAQAGVSAFPAAVSVQMAANIAAGGAGINVLGAAGGAQVRVVDISLNNGQSGPYKVRQGSGQIDREDAMSRSELVAALEMGQRIADEEVDSGADLLIAGDLGIGNTTIAATLIGVATQTEPVVVVGRGTGIDDSGWQRKVAVVRDAMFRVRAQRFDALAVLQAVSSPDMAAMAGFLAQAAVRRTPVILDGVVVTSAALWANKLAPGARRWWMAGHQGAEPAHEIALKSLKLEPLLKFGMRLGEGSGAAAALPLVKVAADIMNDMATFASAGVAEKVADAPATAILEDPAPEDPAPQVQDQ